MSETNSTKSIPSKDIKANPPISQSISLVPNQQSIKMEVLQFKDEVLRELKLLKKSISEKYESNASIISEKLNTYDNKIMSLNERIIELSSKINSDNNTKTDISSLIEFKNKTRDHLLTMEIKINNIDKEMRNNIFRIDNILTDSVLYPGIIGKSCKFKTFHQMLDHILSQISQTITYREKNTLDLNSYKKKLESIVQNLQSQKDGIVSQNNNLINKKMDEIEEKFKSLISLYDERLAGTRAENAEYIKDIEQTMLKFKNELIDFEKLKGRIFEEIKAEGNLLRHENEKTQNIFLGYKKEFNLLKDRFTQLSEFIKDVRFRINLGQEVKKREFFQMSAKIDFSKKQKLDNNSNINFTNFDENETNSEYPELQEYHNSHTNDEEHKDNDNKKSGIFNADTKNKGKSNNINFKRNKKLINNSVNIKLRKNNINKNDGDENNNILKSQNNNVNIDSNNKENNLNKINEENEEENTNKENYINNLNKNDEPDNNNNNNNENNIEENKEDLKIINEEIKENIEEEEKIKIIKEKTNLEKNKDINNKNLNNNNNFPSGIKLNNNQNNTNINFKNNVNGNLNIKNDKNNINNDIYFNEEVNDLSNQIPQNKIILKKTFNGIINRKEPYNNKIESLSQEKYLYNNEEEQKLFIIPKNNFSTINNNSIGNIYQNIIESKKNSKIYYPQNNTKKAFPRTQSAIRSRFPNLNYHLNHLNKKQQTIRPSSSSSNIFSSRNIDNQKLDKNSNINTKATNQNILFEDNNRNIKMKNKKNINDINSEIYFAPSFASFKSNKIKTNLSPNVQALQHGVQQIYDNIYPDKNNQNYNIENIKKMNLNNTDYNYYKKRNLYERNIEAKELQGMIYNLQGYINGYNSNFISQSELREERKKITKNSSYYKFKEMVNENRKNNIDLKRNNNKRNIIDLGFNEYK